MGDSPFALTSFEKWQAELSESHGYNILDLLYWEQRNGNWLTMCQLEFDTAWGEIFTPYNCREFMVNMLAVDEKYRRRPERHLYKALMANLWPEVLSEPINPVKRSLQRRINFS